MSRKDRFKLIPAVYLLLRRDNEVLLLRRVNTGYQDGKYSVIAGHLDGNELATAGIAREAKEEAGVTISAYDLKLVHTCHRLTRNQAGQERLDLFFETDKWQGEVINSEPEKCEDLSWFPVDKLPSNMLPLIRNVINDVERGIIYSEYEEEPVLVGCSAMHSRLRRQFVMMRRRSGCDTAAGPVTALRERGDAGTRGRGRLSWCFLALRCFWVLGKRYGINRVGDMSWTTAGFAWIWPL